MLRVIGSEGKEVRCRRRCCWVWSGFGGRLCSGDDDDYELVQGDMIEAIRCSVVR